MANESIPVYRPGGDLTVIASGAITGKTFVKLSAAPVLATGVNPTVVTATAAGAVFGVAAADAASGANVAVITGSGVILPVTAGGTIAVGAEVEVGANGRAVVYSAGIKVGQAVTLGANAADVLVKLY